MHLKKLMSKYNFVWENSLEKHLPFLRMRIFVEAELLIVNCGCSVDRWLVHWLYMHSKVCSKQFLLKKANRDNTSAEK